MKVTLERAALLKALGHVQRVVERRTTIPILSNVLVRAGAGTLRLKATDLDLEVTEELPADVAQEGATTLPAHTLHDIVRKLPDGSQVTLDMGGDTGQLVLRSGRSRFQLQCLPESDFPDLAAGEMTHRFALPAGQLKHLIDKTSFAISTEETRYYLNGVYLHTMERDGETVLRVVSTDGHRLARVEMAAPQGSAGIPGVIVPRKAVAEIQKLIEDPASDVTVEMSATKIRLTLGSVVLTTKLIDGTFPDYGRVIPAGNDKMLVVPKSAFAAAVDRVSTISAERGRAVKLALSRRQAGAVRQQPRFRLRHGGARRRIRREPLGHRLQRPVPARHHGPARQRHGLPEARRPRLAHPGPGPRGRPGPLRADADAGVRRA